MEPDPAEFMCPGYVRAGLFKATCRHCKMREPHCKRRTALGLPCGATDEQCEWEESERHRAACLIQAVSRGVKARTLTDAEAAIDAAAAALQGAMDAQRAMMWAMVVAAAAEEHQEEQPKAYSQHLCQTF